MTTVAIPSRTGRNRQIPLEERSPELTENPSPSLVAANTVHEIDKAGEETVKSACQLKSSNLAASDDSPSESTSCGSSREEQGDAEVDFVSSVPLSQEERYSRLSGVSKFFSSPDRGRTYEETSLSDSKEDTGDEEITEVMYEAHSNHTVGMFRQLLDVSRCLARLTLHPSRA